MTSPSKSPEVSSSSAPRRPQPHASHQYSHESERHRRSPPDSTSTSSSTTARLTSEMSTATATHSIPIPRMSSSYSSSTRSPPFAHQSYHAHHPSSSARSPSSSSFSSYRSHPYTRRPSNQNTSPNERELPRIQLPPLGGGYGYRAGEPMPTPVPPISSLALQSPEARPMSHRSLSGGSNRGGGSGINLPPIHSISGTTPPLHSPSSMGPPAVSRRSDSPGTASSAGRISPGGPTSGSVGSNYLPGLRPSYSSAYERYSQQSPGREYESFHPPPFPSPHQQREAPPPPPHTTYEQRHRHPIKAEPSSPPLRALPPDFHAPPQSSRYYPQYQQASDERRARSHSTASARAGARGDLDAAPTPGPGQNRRLAHLLSEQKRRESINSGFAALRSALPSSIPTDSKAIILRKAVIHITHLEALLKKAGINPGAGAGAAPVLTPSSWDEGDTEGVDEAAEGDISMMEEDPRDEPEANRAYKRERWDERDEEMKERYQYNRRDSR